MRSTAPSSLEVPVERIPMGEPVERVVSQDSLANLLALAHFVALGRDGSGLS